MFLINPFRIFEKLTEDKVQEIAQAVRALGSRSVLRVLVWCWVGFLASLFSLILTIRLALTLPLF